MSERNLESRIAQLETRLTAVENYARLLEGSIVESFVNGSASLVISERLMMSNAAGRNDSADFLMDLETQCRERVAPQLRARETALVGDATLKRLKQVFEVALAPFRPKN